MYNDKISRYVIFLIVIALISNIILFIWGDSLLNFIYETKDGIEFMVFVLTIILVDATLSLLSFTYILVIKDDSEVSTKLEDKNEIIRDKSAREMRKLIKNWINELKYKSNHLKTQKKSLVEYLNKLGNHNKNVEAERQKITNEAKNLRKIHYNLQNEIDNLVRLDSEEELSKNVIQDRLIKLGEDSNAVEGNLSELEEKLEKYNVKDNEIESSFKKVPDLERELEKLEEELEEILNLVESSIEIYNFKTLKRIGRLFFQSSISIIIGFFILGMVWIGLYNNDVFNALQSLNRVPMQLVLLVITIFIIDGSWSFLRAVYNFFTLYIRD